MPERAAARSLLTAKAVRERAHELLALCEAGQLAHWRIDRSHLHDAARYVVETMRMNYPSLEIPFHSRWRHFAAGGRDRWAALAKQAHWPNAAARGRAAFDLAITSVLLDAGAGPQWRWRDDDGRIYTRSEGLGIASFQLFAEGSLSADQSDPFRADATHLAGFPAAEIARVFQVSDDNPLEGLHGRASLLNALGETVAARPDTFARRDRPRPGGLFDLLAEEAQDGALRAETILIRLLEHLGPIWPSRLTLGEFSLGDFWRHARLLRADPTNGIMPFHKLSQWLAYSLIEPLQEAGIAVTDIDGLTGLPEYRNGGLLVDLGVLIPVDPDELQKPQDPASEFIVEWRALTVALLDEIAIPIREELQMDSTALPLARILEGGTWSAGRRIAREKRADGGPPLAIVSDGTVF